MRWRWLATDTAYVRRAGILYSKRLRHLLLVAPEVAFIFHPLASSVIAHGTVVVLRSFDRMCSNRTMPSPTP